MAEPSAKPRKYTVLAVGMDRRSRVALRIALELNRHKRYTLFESTEPGRPDLAIIDVDNPQGRRHWGDIRSKFPDISAVFISLNNVESNDAPVLRKPLRIEQLFPALDTAASSLGSNRIQSENTPVGSSHKPVASQLFRGSTNHINGARIARPRFTDKTAPVGHKPLTLTPPPHFDPDKGLLGLLRQLNNSNTAAWIDSADRKGIIAVLPEGNKASVNVSDEELRRLCEEGTGLNHWPLGQAAFRKLKNDAYPSLDSVVWNAALWTARGRVPIGITVADTYFQLTSWPNFTRLKPIADGMRIAAFLAKTEASITLVVKMLDVKPENVYNFISAAYSLGLLKQRNREREAIAPINIQPQTAKERELRGLLSRLLDKITGT